MTSRSAIEYYAMFDLSAADLRATAILDCCAGGSSFAAETGDNVVAVDPAYALHPDEIAVRVEDGLRAGDSIIDQHDERFEWDWYGHPGQRAGLRRDAAGRFLADLRARPGRYLPGALPDLPLASDRFDLVLCSHMLFTWAETFGEDWHLAAVNELVRVARGQIRIFPLVTQGTGSLVPFLGRLRDHLRGRGQRSTLSEVPYRFQRGADRMLVIDAHPRR